MPVVAVICRAGAFEELEEAHPERKANKIKDIEIRRILFFLSCWVHPVTADSKQNAAAL